jgi:hypothetical protein
MHRTGQIRLAPRHAHPICEDLFDLGDIHRALPMRLPNAGPSYDRVSDLVTSHVACSEAVT